MTYEYNHDNYLSRATFHQQNLDPNSFDRGGFYDGAIFSACSNACAPSIGRIKVENFVISDIV